MNDEKEEKLMAARLKAIQDMPAVFVDTFSVFVWDNYVRFTMGEDFSEGDRFRTAFVMPVSDAEVLGKRIIELIAKHREKEKQKEQEKTPENT